MSDGRPQPTIDELLDEYVNAWHAGEAPSTAAFVARAPEADREEFTQILATFLELAPTVDPTPARVRELGADPLVQRLAGLEGARWEALESAGAGAGEAAAAPSAAGEPGTTWGERLRALREAAGLSVGDLAERFAERFGLSDADAAAAPAALGSLESGGLASAGVAARAARALEELLAAPRGMLVAGAAPAVGGPLLRGVLPESPDEQARFAELLREVDDALAVERSADAGQGETLSDLLGA